ncbi:MAG: hypothetical protein WC423_15450 [Vulcanimicrobiota bacterium]
MLLLLVFLASSAPSLAISKTPYSGVSPLKAGHSNRIEANNNPVNMVDPEGLKPGDFTDPISNAAYMNAGADAAVDRGDHFQAFLWRAGAVLPDVIAASTAQAAGTKNGLGEASALENLYHAFVLGTAPFVGGASSGNFISRSGGFSRLALLNAAIATGKGGSLTRIGHAIAKHGGRTQSRIVCPPGNESVINPYAQEFGKRILNSIRSRPTSRHHARYGQIIDIKKPGDFGLRFKADGTFMGILE